MKKSLFIAFILIGFIHSVNAQSSMSTEYSQKPQTRFTIKPNFSNVNSKNIVPVFANQTVTLQETLYTRNSYYGVEGLYKFNRLWSAGAYLGYSYGTFISNETGTTSNSFAIDKLGKSYFYGLKGELQLLPLLFKLEGLRLNVYCPIQAGLVSESITTIKTNTNNWEKPAFEIGAGVGVGYNFTKNIGVFGEYQFGHFYNQRNSQWKVGLAISL